MNNAGVREGAVQVDESQVDMRIVTEKHVVVNDQNCHRVVGLRFRPVLDVGS